MPIYCCFGHFMIFVFTNLKNKWSGFKLVAIVTLSRPWINLSYGSFHCLRSRFALRVWSDKQKVVLISLYLLMTTCSFLSDSNLSVRCGQFFCSAVLLQDLQIVMKEKSREQLMMCCHSCCTKGRKEEWHTLVNPLHLLIKVCLTLWW